MRNLFRAMSFLGAWPKGLLVLLWAGSAGAVLPEPEDSPLFANSRQRAFADMASRDRELWSRRTGPAAVQGYGPVIVVEGTHWQSIGEPKQPTGTGGVPPPGGGAFGGGIRPFDVTIDYFSCSIPTMCNTCAATSCGASCDTTPTCWASPTCRGPTCTQASCKGPTCSEPTCWGVSCSMPGPTCYPYMSCDSGPTCGNPTCNSSTCIPAVCPVALRDIQVPRAGEVQLSFLSGQLLYALQYCTNLAQGQWTTVASVRGDGTVMTLRHTNAAPIACYRLFVSP